MEMDNLVWFNLNKIFYVRKLAIIFAVNLCSIGYCSIIIIIWSNSLKVLTYIIDGV